MDVLGNKNNNNMRTVDIAHTRCLGNSEALAMHIGKMLNCVEAQNYAEQFHHN